MVRGKKRADERQTKRYKKEGMRVYEGRKDMERIGEERTEKKGGVLGVGGEGTNRGGG